MEVLKDFQNSGILIEVTDVFLIFRFCCLTASLHVCSNLSNKCHPWQVSLHCVNDARLTSNHCVIIIFWHKKFCDLIVNQTNKTTILLITVPFTVLLLFYFINNNSPDTYIIYPDNGIGKHLTEQELWQITFIKLMKLYYNYYSTRPYHQIHHTLK